MKNTIEQKLNNLKEVIENIRTKKDVEKASDYNDNYIFITDRMLSDYYNKAVRIVDINNLHAQGYYYFINDYSFDIANNKISFKDKKFYIVYKRANKDKYEGDLISFNEYQNQEIDKKIMDIIINKEGTKKQFKEIPENYLRIFLNDNPNFLNQSNIEKIIMEIQLKDF